MLEKISDLRQIYTHSLLLTVSHVCPANLESYLLLSILILRSAMQALKQLSKKKSLSSLVQNHRIAEVGKGH